MGTSPEFSFRLVPLTLQLLEARGVSEAVRRHLLEELPPGAATAPVVTVHLDRLSSFLGRAEASAGLPSLGVALAEAVPRGTYAWLEFIARLSCTLEEAMVAVGRYYRLINKGADIEYFERGELAGVEINVHGRKLGWGRQLNEYTVALFHRVTRELAPDWRCSHVWFAHAEPLPAAVDALTATFGVRPGFGLATCGFDGPGALVDQPLSSGDAALQTLLRSHAVKTLEAEMPMAALGEQLREVLKARLGSGDLGVDAVAGAMGLTARTLQRRLRDEGLSYQTVLDAVRAQVARAWLANAGRSVNGLAAKLGYSETGALDRAFRRWTGKTPTEWRSVTPA